MKEQEGVLSMVILGGLFLIGKLVGGNKLVKPRIFSTYLEDVVDESKPNRPKVIDPNTGQPMQKQMISMSPPPGTPPFLRIGIDASSYPVPDRPENKNIFELYERVTNVSVDPGA